MKQQWEYKTWKYESWKDGSPEEEINKLGAEGWELSVGFQNGGSMLLIFKRIKQ